MARAMTARQRAALKKAQAASARKRRGKGKLRRAARKVGSGYKKYNRGVQRTKARAVRARGRFAKKYPKTTKTARTALVLGALGVNMAYRFKSPITLKHGQPTPNPTYFPPRKKR